MPGQIVHFEIPASHDPDHPGPDRRGDHQHGARQARNSRLLRRRRLNAGAARVKELGGEANEPMPGNEFGLWQHDTSASTPTQ